MSDTLPPSSNEPMAASIVASPIGIDIACAHCGYNLRGLVREMRCPECGTPVGQSFHGKLLRFADSHWLRRVRIGTSLKLWNILFVILLTGGLIFLRSVGAPRFFSLLVLIVIATLGVAAAFLITSPEPSAVMEESGLSLRRVIRASAICVFVGGILQNVADIGGTIRSVPSIAASSKAAHILLFVFGALLQLAGIAQMFGEFVYFRRFARRIPDPKLEQSTSTVMWGLVISYAAILAVGTIGAVIGIMALTATTGLGGGGTPPLPPAAAGGIVLMGFAGCFAGMSLFVFGIWYLVLLISYRQAFKFAADSQGPPPA
ncbi:MAG: hypothetical protein HY287_11575 [Planctomycetes bacterium]|nr:hypothetical protein [Planctomycetota bacterium]